MAQIIPFPSAATATTDLPSVTATTQKNTCTGCSGTLPGTYWEIGIPKESGKEYVALCDSCYEELMKHGVVL